MRQTQQENSNPKPKRQPRQKDSGPDGLLDTLPDWINISGVKQACDGATPRWWRLVWTAVILTGIAFPIYQISTQVAYYLSRPITVRLIMRSALELRFPPVTFCNLNIARRSALETLNITHLTPYFDVRNARRFGDVDAEDEEQLSQYDWAEIYQQVGHQLEDMLISCVWKGQKCGVEDFTTTFTDSGVCFTFNKAETETVQLAGRGGALALLLNVQQDEYLPSSMLAGAEVMVEERDNPPLLSDHSVSAPVGAWTSVVMHRKTIMHVEPPWEDCVVVDHSSDSSYPGREMCNFNCYVQQVIRNCTCRLPYMPEDPPKGASNLTGPVRVCSPVEMYLCALPTFYDIRKGYDECAAKCNLQSCVQEGFETMTSEATFSQIYLQTLSQDLNISLEEVRHNFLGVEVYYRDMKEESVDNTIAYTGIELFCDIGGAMGLILGASLATVLEFIDVLFRQHACNTHK